MKYQASKVDKTYFQMRLFQSRILVNITSVALFKSTNFFIEKKKQKKNKKKTKTKGTN